MLLGAPILRPLPPEALKSVEALETENLWSVDRFACYIFVVEAVGLLILWPHGPPVLWSFWFSPVTFICAAWKKFLALLYLLC